MLKNMLYNHAFCLSFVGLCIIFVNLWLEFIYIYRFVRNAAFIVTFILRPTKH